MTTDYARVESAGQSLSPLDMLANLPGRRGTLLLVEDSRLSSEAIRMMFRGAAGRLRRADSLRSARRHLSLYMPDAILIDLGLPDGSGLDLIAELSRHRPRVPRIIAISGQPEMEETAYAFGADAFIAKPIESLAHFRTLLAPDFFPISEADAPARGRRSTATAARDDLYLALDLLLMGRTLDQRKYALQFIEGVARILEDAELLTAVQQADTDSIPKQVMQILRTRLLGHPLI